jgi:hypothetical protein
MQGEDRDSRLFNELHQIRTELHAIRESFEKRGMQEQFEAHVNELEIEMSQSHYPHTSYHSSGPAA